MKRPVGTPTGRKDERPSDPLGCAGPSSFPCDGGARRIAGAYSAAMTSPPEAGTARRALLWPLVFAGVALASILFYTLPFGVRGLQMPFGDDTLFYVVVHQRVPLLGITDPAVAARP